MLHAFVKKTPDTPEKELKITRKRMKEVQSPASPRRQLQS